MTGRAVGARELKPESRLSGGRREFGAFDYACLADMVRYLESRKVEAGLHKKRPIPARTLRQRNKRDFGGALPECILRIYSFSDGLEFWWSDPSADLHGGLELPTLDRLQSWYGIWERCIVDCEFDEKLRPSPLYLVPIIGESNGDWFCIDVETATVWYNAHEIGPFPDARQGHLVAHTWDEFLHRWAAICFEWPASLTWLNALGGTDGVKWRGSEFTRSFRWPSE